MGGTNKNDAAESREFEREKYRALFENSITALFITKPDGAILEANNAACEMFNYSLDEFRQLGRQGVIDPKTPDLEKKLREREKSGSTQGKLIGIRKGGERFWCEFSSSIFTDKKGEKMSTVMMVDISDQKLAEERLTSVTNNLPGVVFRYVKHQGSGDELRYVNEGAKKIWGVEPSVAMSDNNTVWDAIHKEDIDEVFQSIDDSEKNLSPWLKEWRYHHPEKGMRWHRGVGNPVRLEEGRIAWDSIIMDVTEEVEAKQNLDFKEKHLSLIFNTINDVIFTVETADQENFYFTSVNNQFLDNLGKNREEVLGQFIEDVLPEKSVRFVKHKYLQAIETKERLQWEETIDLNIGQRTGIVSVTPVFKEGTNTVQLIGSIADITERKAAEDSLKKIMDQSLDVICTISEEGKFVRVSGASKNVWGYDPKELCGRAYMDFVHSEDRGLTEEMAVEIMDGKQITNFENRYVRKDGSVVDMIWSARWDDDDRLMYCVAKDATELNRAKLEMELLINNTEESFVLLDKDLEIVSLNDQFERLYKKYFGTSVKKGDSIIDYAQPGRREIVKGIYERVLDGNEETSQITIPLSDQTEKIISIRFKPAKNENCEIIGVFVTAIDITEELRAWKQLEESKERYEYVTRATSDAIWDFVPATGNLFWGEGFKILFGYERKNVADGIEKWMKRIHPNDIGRVEKGVKELLEGNATHWNEEYRFKKADGSYAFVHDKAIVIRGEDGITQRVVGAMEDITQRKEEEQQLKLMESVVINTGDSVLITKAEPFDAPEGPEIVYVNEAFEKMTGYKAHEVIGETPRILQGPNSDDEALKEFGKKIRRWEPASLETINYKKNGEEFWIHFSVTPVADEKGWYTHWISIERDVTERKNRELKQNLLSEIGAIFNEQADLRESLNQTLHYLKSYGNFALAEFWLADQNREILERAAYIEEGLEEFYDSKFDVKTLTKGESLPGTAWKSGETQFWSNLEERSDFVWKDGAEAVGLKTGYGFPVKADGKVMGVLMFAVRELRNKPEYFVTIFEEILDRLGEEIKRKDVEEELSRIFTSAPDGIIVAGFDGYFKKVNPAMSEILGYSEEELLNTPFIEFIHPDDRQETLQMYEEANSGAEKFYFENRYITKTGQVVWLLWTFKVFYDEEVAYSVAKNITDQKKIEKQLKELNVSLEKQTKELEASNAELEQFAFVASHDLQEPLRMITSFLAQLERKYNDVLDEKGKRYIHFASDGAKRMRQIILDLLDYSRVSRVESEKEDVETEEVIRSVVSLYRRVIDKKNAEVNWENLPSIYAEKGSVQQLFQNLISNSLHYQEAENKPVIKVGAEDAGSHWKFYVKDNGIGINPEYTDKIFNIFQRLHGKEEYSGTGVGLAICKKIVEDHGGTIWVESKEGEGSTFIFTIAKPQNNGYKKGKE